jgi:hypothetical protein
MYWSVRHVICRIRNVQIEVLQTETLLYSLQNEIKAMDYENNYISELILFFFLVVIPGGWEVGQCWGKLSNSDR